MKQGGLPIGCSSRGQVVFIESDRLPLLLLWMGSTVPCNLQSHSDRNFAVNVRIVVRGISEMVWVKWYWEEGFRFCVTALSSISFSSLLQLTWPSCLCTASPPNLNMNLLCCWAKSCPSFNVIVFYIQKTLIVLCDFQFRQIWLSSC